jgi:hypothetical protein
VGGPYWLGKIAGSSHGVTDEDDPRKRRFLRSRGAVIRGPSATVDTCRDNVEERSAAGGVDVLQELQIVDAAWIGERIELGEEHDRIRIRAPRRVGANC